MSNLTTLEWPDDDDEDRDPIYLDEDFEDWHSQYDDDPNPYHGNYFEDDDLDDFYESIL